MAQEIGKEGKRLARMSTGMAGQTKGQETNA